MFGGKVQESNKDRCAAALQEKVGSVIADIHATIRTASRPAFGRAEAAYPWRVETLAAPLLSRNCDARKPRSNDEQETPPNGVGDRAPYLPQRLPCPVAPCYAPSLPHQKVFIARTQTIEQDIDQFIRHLRMCVPDPVSYTHLTLPTT